MTQQVTAVEPRLGCEPGTVEVRVGNVRYPLDATGAASPDWSAHPGVAAPRCVNAAWREGDPLLITAVPEPDFVLALVVGVLVLVGPARGWRA